MGLFARDRFDVPCTVEIEHSPESLHAYVLLDGDIAIYPGDEVKLHGAALNVPFGQRITVRRHATVTRAGPLARAWTRLTAYHELTELFEVSFSDARTL